jgi:hypothetical protein
VAEFLDLSTVYQPYGNPDNRQQTGGIVDGDDEEVGMFSFHSLEHSEYFRFLIGLCGSRSICKIDPHNCGALKSRVPYNLSHEIDDIVNKGKSPQHLAVLVNFVLNHLRVPLDWK